MKREARIWLAIVYLAGAFVAFALWHGPISVQAQNYAPSQYSYIAASGDTAVRDGAGELGSVVVNGGTAGTITLYDIAALGCTGTPASGKFATIETIGSTNPVSLPYNLRVKNGICAVLSANTDVTVTWQ